MSKGYRSPNMNSHVEHAVHESVNRYSLNKYHALANAAQCYLSHMECCGLLPKDEKAFDRINKSKHILYNSVESEKTILFSEDEKRKFDEDFKPVLDLRGENWSSILVYVKLESIIHQWYVEALETGDINFPPVSVEFPSFLTRFNGLKE